MNGIMIVFEISEYYILVNRHAFNRVGATQFDPEHKGNLWPSGASLPPAETLERASKPRTNIIPYTKTAQ